MANSRPTPTRKRNRTGCGYLTLTCAFSCLFLVINGALVSAVYNYLASFGPPLARHPKVAQGVLFVVPVLLIFVEWWIVDVATRTAGWLRGSGSDR